MALYISLVGVNVASLAFESLLYGIFLILSLTSFYLLFAKEKFSDRPKNRLTALGTPLILANFLMTAAISGHWVLTVVRAFQAFVRVRGGRRPLDFYQDLSHPLFISTTALVIITLIIGDGVVIYRLRTVFKYNRSTAVFPLCCLFGFIACGIGTVFQFSKLSTNKNVFLASIGIVFTFITNIFCSAFVAWKIYRVNSATTNYTGQNLGSITGIIVESAALYTAWTIMFMAAFLAGSNLVHIFADTIPVITGIAFMVINVRIGFGWAVDLAKSIEKGATTHSISFRPSGNAAANAVRSTDSDRQRGTGGATSYPMRALAVHVERSVVKEDDFGSMEDRDDHGHSRRQLESLGSDTNSSKPSATLDRSVYV